MTAIVQRYDRLSAAFAAKVAGVPDDRWDAPTPCADWSVRDLVRHVVDSHATFIALIDRELPTGPSVDEDPVEAFASARRTFLALLEDEVTATQTYEGQFGTQTFAWARGAGVFGPELEAPADADGQTRVLAFLGRQA
jgi:hypothetical protein